MLTPYFFSANDAAKEDASFDTICSQAQRDTANFQLVGPCHTSATWQPKIGKFILPANSDQSDLAQSNSKHPPAGREDRMPRGREAGAGEGKKVRSYIVKVLGFALRLGINGTNRRVLMPCFYSVFLGGLGPL